MTVSAEVISVLAPQFLGIIFNWALLGGLAVQVYIYSTRSKQDRPFISVLVYSIFVVEIIHTGFLTHGPWVMLVSEWGNIDVMVHRPWSSLTMPILTGILSATVQFFFSWRIWILSQKRTRWTIVAVVIAVVALAQCSAALADGIGFSLHSNDVDVISRMFLGIVVWLAGSLICDLIITASIFYLPAFPSALHGSEKYSIPADSTSLRPTHYCDTGDWSIDLSPIPTKITIRRPDMSWANCLVPSYLVEGYSNFTRYSNALLATLNARSDEGGVLSTATLRGGPVATHSFSFAPESGERNGNNNVYELSPRTKMDVLVQHESWKSTND
ncbi:hypothetical protein C8J56DRAFT_1056305 [Mycena floridula]|nr:hypothetical protein C8J56DRAFT_1056305 [Mycena floridula]